MNRRMLPALALATPLILAGCLEGISVPQHTINDVSFEVREQSVTIDHLAVDNPNNTRVGARFSIRVFREGQVEPVYTGTQAVYVPPRGATTESFNLTEYCGDAPETCGEYRVHAVLRETYWLAND